MNRRFEREHVDRAWCPGCGNFGILRILTEVLEPLALKPSDIAVVSGIGQAAKTPYYLDVNMFGGLHGRALPVATTLKAVNPNLTVIAEGGDGDMYGEGGNHFLHTIRRNVNILHIVHNNMVYGLTKGQASPTSMQGFRTPIQPGGVHLEPFNPLAVALALGAGFVARVNVGNAEHAKAVLTAALSHNGYALVDIFQPCVTFNTLNTYSWFKEHTFQISDDHDSSDRLAAISLAWERDSLPLGIFYRETRETFEHQCRHQSDIPLYESRHDLAKLQHLFNRL